MSVKNLFNHIKYFIRISRPLNVFITFITIWIAAVIAGNYYFTIRLFYACLTASLIAGGANIINDIYDIEIDRINKPKRLLPSGVITPAIARFYFYSAYSLAFVFALLNGWDMLIIAFIIGLALYGYSARLKQTVLWGNLLVSFSGAMAFIYGAMAAGEWKAGIIPAVFAFLFHLGREIIKDMQDLEGDLAKKAVTFPGRYGLKKAIGLVNIVFILLVILTILPYILHVYNLTYLYIVIIGVDSVLAAVSLILWKKHNYSDLGKLSHLLKLDIFICLIAVYIGAQNVVFFN